MLITQQPFQHPGPVAVAAGPAFALLVPTTYVTEAPAPTHALHPQAHHDPASIGAEVAVLIVCLFVAARLVFVRVIALPENG
jgi:hypothetical protein